MEEGEKLVNLKRVEGSYLVYGEGNSDVFEEKCPAFTAPTNGGDLCRGLRACK
jgi:hypothetical protein